MQPSRLLALTFFALFSILAAGHLTAAAPLLTPTDADGGATAAAGTAKSSSDNNTQTEDEVLGAASSEEILPTSDEEEEGLDISQRLTEPDVSMPVNYILSVATGQFVAITKSSRVQAKTQIGRLVAQFTMLYSRIDGREHVSLRSVKYEDRGWYLTINSNGRVRGKIPSNGNEIFEVVTIGPHVALRLRRSLAREGSGGEEVLDVPCFLGFSEEGRPSCYSSASRVETQFQFLDASS